MAKHRAYMEQHYILCYQMQFFYFTIVEIGLTSQGADSQIGQ